MASPTDLQHIPSISPANTEPTGNIPSISPANMEPTANIPSISPANTEPTSNIQTTPELMNVSPINDCSPLQLSLAEAVRQKDWLHTQNLQLKAQLEARKPDYHKEIDRLPPDKLQDLYESLSEELVQKTVIHDSRQLLLDGEHLKQTMIKILGRDVGHGDGIDTRELEMLVDMVMKMNSQVFQEQQETKMLKEELESLKMENFELLKRSRQLYSQIGEKRNEMEEKIKTLSTDEKGKSIHEKLQKLFQEDIVQRCTLQILILGSGINWGQDSEIQKLLLDCGKNEQI